MSQEVHKESFEMGDVIFRQGAQESHFFIIEEGQVGIFVNKNGEDKKIAEFGPGESFGEFALLDNSPRSASAEALSPLTVFRVSDKGFEELLAPLPDWASMMLKSFVSRMKAMNEKLKDHPQF